MQRTMASVAIVLGLGAGLVRAQAADSRLTIADVEKISGPRLTQDQLKAAAIILSRL